MDNRYAANAGACLPVRAAIFCLLEDIFSEHAAIFCMHADQTLRARSHSPHACRSNTVNTKTSSASAELFSTRVRTEHSEHKAVFCVHEDPGVERRRVFLHACHLSVRARTKPLPCKIERCDQRLRRRYRKPPRSSTSADDAVNRPERQSGLGPEETFETPDSPPNSGHHKMTLALRSLITASYQANCDNLAASTCIIILGCNGSVYSPAHSNCATVSSRAQSPPSGKG